MIIFYLKRIIDEVISFFLNTDCVKKRVHFLYIERKIYLKEFFFKSDLLVSSLPRIHRTVDLEKLCGIVRGQPQPWLGFHPYLEIVFLTEQFIERKSCYKFTRLIYYKSILSKCNQILLRDCRKMYFHWV